MRSKTKCVRLTATKSDCGGGSTVCRMQQSELPPGQPKPPASQVYPFLGSVEARGGANSAAVSKMRRPASCDNNSRQTYLHRKSLANPTIQKKPTQRKTPAPAKSPEQPRPHCKESSLPRTRLLAVSSESPAPPVDTSGSEIVASAQIFTVWKLPRERKLLKIYQCQQPATRCSHLIAPQLLVYCRRHPGQQHG